MNEKKTGTIRLLHFALSGLKRFLPTELRGYPTGFGCDVYMLYQYVTRRLVRFLTLGIVRRTYLASVVG